MAIAEGFRDVPLPIVIYDVPRIEFVDRASDYQSLLELQYTYLRSIGFRDPLISNPNEIFTRANMEPLWTRSFEDKFDLVIPRKGTIAVDNSLFSVRTYLGDFGKDVHFELEREQVRDADANSVVIERVFRNHRYEGLTVARSSSLDNKRVDIAHLEFLFDEGGYASDWVHSSVGVSLDNLAEAKKPFFRL